MTNSNSTTRCRLEVLGAKIDRISLPAAVERIGGWIEEPAATTRVVVATGFHGLWMASRNPLFLKILNQADLFCPDGIAPVWLSKLAGEPLPGRVPGPDLMAGLLEWASSNGHSSYFLGSDEQTLAALRRRLERQYPGHRIAGMFAPPFRPFTPSENDDIVRSINRAQPSILWVGLGLPKQEIWIHEHFDRLEVPVAIGVGAAFEFLSGNVARTPKWLGDAGFEWAWRLAKEPAKLWRRDLIDGPQFLCHAALETLRSRRDRQKSA